MSSNLSSSYFDLVVKTVRGGTPIPEYKKLKKKDGKWPWQEIKPMALTMCGRKNIGLVIEALKTIHQEKVPGDLIETGVWRGGIPLIMRAFLQSVGDTERTVWIADSFQGLPDDLSDSKDKLAHFILRPFGKLAVSRQAVEEAFDFFGLKDQQVQFLEGWFKDTLKTMPDKPLAIIRLDGDYYESTRDALQDLYPRLSPGGYLIVDDYGLPLGCKRAVHEYREQHNITEPIVSINTESVYWRKAG